jgi:hypothetical protein
MPEQTILKVGNTMLRFNYEQNDAALFLALGAALAEVQALEFHLVQMMGLLLSNEGASHDEVTDQFFQVTLGTLARKMRGEVGAPELAEALDRVVKERNHLVHGFLRAHKWPMLSADGYLNAIQELDKAAKFFRESGETITVALKKAKDLPVFLLRINPETGLPEHL